MGLVLAADSVFDDAAQTRLNQVIDGLNDSLVSPNFFVSVRVKDAPDRPPSIARIRSFLEDRLRGLNPDEVAEVMKARGLEDYDRWSYTDGDWEVVFSPIPMAPAFRGQPGARPIGEVLYAGVEDEWLEDENVEVHPEKPLLKALEKKAGRYGVLELPYVVAVDATDPRTEESDVGDALFGPKVARYNKETRQISFVHSGVDALWVGLEGPRYRRVSAVFVARWLRADTIGTIETPALWHNPWASKRLDPMLWRGPQKVSDPKTLTMGDRVGEDFLKILGLNAECSD